jgi:hypothetical protein
LEYLSREADANSADHAFPCETSSIRDESTLKAGLPSRSKRMCNGDAPPPVKEKAMRRRQFLPPTDDVFLICVSSAPSVVADVRFVTPHNSR